MTRDWWPLFSGLAFEGIDSAYTLGSLCGVGGFFESTYRRFPCPVASKLVIPGADEFDTQFRELVRSLQLHHLTLVHTLDYGTITLTHGRFLSIAMEVGSTTLKDVLAANPLPPAEARRMAISIAAGLAYLHRQHRLVQHEMKPANVLRFGDARKLTGCGVARTVDTKSSACTSRLVGPVDYMPLRKHRRLRLPRLGCLGLRCPRRPRPVTPQTFRR